MPKVLYSGSPEENTSLPETLEKNGYNVIVMPDLNESIDILQQEDFDFFIADIPEHMGTNDTLISSISNDHPELQCIFFSGSNYPEDILTTLNNSARTETNSVAGSSEKNMGKTFQFYDVVGESEKIKNISGIVEKVSATDSTVLITGESGTGKELIARAIHKNSKRYDKPMIIINCGAIPGELLESELFGHEKGAFTSAHRTRIGRFELANGGTIFLDEIGDMSPDLQVKLLRVIQNRQFERVGGLKSINVDVRIISATNKNLTKAIEENTFREDLYYRLNVIPIEVPPLRNRKTDIPLLIKHFEQKLQKQNDWEEMGFSDEAMHILCNYRWAGNIRELENFVERLHVLVDSKTIMPEDIPDYMIGAQSDENSLLQISECFGNGKGFNEAIDSHQKKLILHALNETNWVKAKAAELLQMKRTTLVEKIKKMNLEAERKVQP